MVFLTTWVLVGVGALAADLARLTLYEMARRQRVSMGLAALALVVMAVKSAVLGPLRSRYYTRATKIEGVDS